jgi:hypothetical protein
VPARPGCTTPRIRFLFIAPRFCLGLPPDPASRRRPCPSANLRLCVHLVSGLAPDSLRAMPGTHRDREKPHGSPLPHHRADGSRTRRFGRLSRPVESPSAEAAQGFSARKPEPHLYPLQAHVHPVGCSHGLHWTTITPLFQVPLGTPFGPSVGSLAPRRRLPYYALC